MNANDTDNDDDVLVVTIWTVEVSSTENHEVIQRYTTRESALEHARDLIASDPINALDDYDIDENFNARDWRASAGRYDHTVIVREVLVETEFRGDSE